MIGRITGTLIEKHPPMICVDVHGVGYDIDVPMSSFYQLGEVGSTVTLFTHLSIRDDAHVLYGFSNEAERRSFRQLIKVSGIGARTALSLLSGLSAAELHSAVEHQDIGRLTTVPGIGKKTAERLLLELRGKLDQPAGGTVPAASSNTERGDMLNALLALGYNHSDSQKALKQVGDDVSVSEGIRQALQFLSKR